MFFFVKGAISSGASGLVGSPGIGVPSGVNYSGFNLAVAVLFAGAAVSTLSPADVSTFAGAAFSFLAGAAFSALAGAAFSVLAGAGSSWIYAKFGEMVNVTEPLCLTALALLIRAITAKES